MLMLDQNSSMLTRQKTTMPCKPKSLMPKPHQHSKLRESLNGEYKLEKPANVFEDDLNHFKPAFDHSHAKLNKKIDYYYTPYAPIL
jgi:hypothetical protein